MFVRRREVVVSVFVQVVLGLFLAHGYDFQVSYVAGRNIVCGSSPYEGGFVEDVLASGYGSYVQGIGETPLWALYTGAAYFLSSGQIFVFNILLKIPIIAANLFLSYFIKMRNGDYRFFLFNPFLLLVTAVWGKPDNIAALLALLALYGSHKALNLSVSLMVKPLAVAMAPAFICAWLRNMKTIIYTVTFSTLLFFLPFAAFGWPLETVLNGFVNWFKPAGGISIMNLVEYFYNSPVLPETFQAVGYLSVFAILLAIFIGVVFPPTTVDGIARLGLFSASLFFTVRPWVSEQNLIIIHALLIVISNRLPTRLLWVIPLVFAGVNFAIPQQLYLLWPEVVETLALFDHSTRLLAKFLVAVIWWWVLWYVIWRKNLWRWMR